MAKITDNSRYSILREFSEAKNITKRENGNSKSYAQVATSVRHQSVGRNSGELKLNDLREFRISVRFSKNERETLVRHAEKSRLTISDHIRIAALGPTYAYAIDPEKYQLLRQANRELGRQGTNLNQIAHAMNMPHTMAENGETLLGRIFQSLMAAHDAVRHALTEHRTYD